MSINGTRRYFGPQERTNQQKVTGNSPIENKFDNKHGSSSFIAKKTSKQKTSKNSNNNKK